MKRKVIRVGNSLAITLPPKSLQAIGTHEGEIVDVEVEPSGLRIRPATDLAALVADWTPLGTAASTVDIVEVIRRDRDSH
ncbi:MAG: hypothetical protein JOZ39_03295 [Chloroflexi bacterium]|nr:hypothetical protein [Chloroflexota bacterium]